MRRRQSEQDRADALLQEWGALRERALAHGFSPAPLQPTVQGSRPDATDPERYVDDEDRFEDLDWAVQRVGDHDPRWKGVLRQVYTQSRLNEQGRPDEPRMAEEMGVSLPIWRRWLKQARRLFLHHAEGG